MSRFLLKKQTLFSVQFWKWAAFLLLIYWIFYQNTLHESYPDEFDNILGGWYILHGKLPYTGFFSHHGPVPYYIAAVIQVFTGHSFVHFRYGYSIFLFLLTFGVYWYFRQRFGVIYSRIYLVFAVIIGIAATYFWGHMLIADSISGFFLSFAFAFFLLQYIAKTPLRLRDIIFVSVFTFLGLLSSLTYIYLCLFIYLYLAYLYFTSYPFPWSYRSLMRAVVIVNLPYILFFLYLLLTRSLSDYLYQSIIFNQRYYIYFQNTVGPAPKNPIRQMVVIAYNFFHNFSTLLIQTSNFKFSYPFNITLAIADVGLCVYLFMQKRAGLLIFVLTFLVFANARSNPLDSGETDYQSAVYIMASLFSMVFILHQFYGSLQKHIAYPSKIIYSVLFFLICIYSFFTMLFLINKFSEKSYSKYMGTQALIYDRPQIAPIINAVASKDDYAWIGPLEFEDLYYMNAKLPSKYQMFIPGMGKSDKIPADMLAEFNAHKPKVIYFSEHFSILGQPPTQYGQFFLQFLRDNYITLYDYQDDDTKYVSVNHVTLHVDIEKNLYINKNNISEVISDLQAHNLVKKQQILPVQEVVQTKAIKL